ncbi:MAG: hypothetical protein ABI791_01500 [Acidobacteriota bacterium]
MIGLIAFIAVFIVTYQVYKSAVSTERNPWFWAGLTLVTGFGLQVVLPMLFGIVLAVYYSVTGTPPERLESEITGLIGVFGLVSLVLSIVGMVLIMKHVSKVKDDVPATYTQGPPPPPNFGGGIQ